ncbi:hypothetical protein [Glutamicibacter arilaitensis]|uniref:hypothetical protein n=1 Tax=Glutamicibacter arilaitensis TaxID=256701 RepID=UPI003850A881
MTMIDLGLIVPRGLILPENVLYSSWFSVLASFVAINTLIYLVLGVMKIIPVIRLSAGRGRERRSETRNIDPDASV